LIKDILQNYVRSTLQKEVRWFSDAAEAKQIDGVKGSDYVTIVYDKLYKSTFHSVRTEDLEQWLYVTSKEQVVKLIPDPIDGVCIISEILSANNELDLPHPVYANSDPEKSRDPYERENHVIDHLIPEKPCFFSRLPYPHKWAKAGPTHFALDDWKKHSGSRCG
jgi:hypothetical protein